MAPHFKIADAMVASIHVDWRVDEFRPDILRLQRHESHHGAKFWHKRGVVLAIWFVLEGAIVGIIIGYFATRFGGEGKETVEERGTIPYGQKTQ